MPRSDDPAAVGREITLPETVAHHALRVLRLGEGDSITLFDGMGGEYSATIAADGYVSRGSCRRPDAGTR